MSGSQRKCVLTHSLSDGSTCQVATWQPNPIIDNTLPSTKYVDLSTKNTFVLYLIVWGTVHNQCHTWMIKIAATWQTQDITLACS